MLKLIDIKKDYVTGDSTVHALRGVSMEFRKSEFVSILGQSGCGKTTLLNIIGGLDKYTSGDLIINGKSTKEFKDRDWDTYRNHSIGFVFQSYNLIPHQSVLSNVELALTLSGVSAKERKRRAIEALTKVGLGDQINKKPNQMSGGQMQRVAIARALVNDPEILLADEPTGALDSETSVQIMELIKEISKDRLVIMVTHNPDLAKEYSTRIINLLDGNVVSDTNPYVSEGKIVASDVTENEIKEKKEDKIKADSGKDKKKKTSMSFFTAFLLSLNNLLTKKGRTILTSFAGSIGIIGIALIFAVSNGMNAYINHVQESTLSSYPLSIQSETVDMSSLITTILGANEDDEDKDADRDPNTLYKDQLIGELVEALSKTDVNENDLASFKTYVEAEIKKEGSPLSKAISAIQYAYNLNLTVYTKNTSGEIIKSDTNALMADMLADYFVKVGLAGGDDSSSSSLGSGNQSSMFGSMMNAQMWQELLPGIKEGTVISDVLTNQYDLIHGQWPNEHDEIVLVVDAENELDDLTLYALGLLSEADIDAIIDAAANGTTLPENPSHKWSFDDICNKLSFKVILPADCYKDLGGGIFVDLSTDKTLLSGLYDDALELKVSGIIRLKDSVDQGMLTGSIGYTSLLTEYVIEKAVTSDVVIAQTLNPTIDVLTGLPFKSTSDSMTDEEKAEYFKEYVSEMSVKEKAELYVKIACLKAYESSLDAGVEQAMGQMTDRDALILQISSAIANEMGTTPDAIKSFFEKYTLDELKEILRPTVVEGVKMQIASKVSSQLSILTDDQKAMALAGELASATNESHAVYYDELVKFSTTTYEDNLVLFGNVEKGSPSTINIYTSTFEQKDQVKAIIDDYNDTVEESKQIKYTDYIGLMMSSITQIINAITYVLVAFVATSLIVSSIMIGVITLISVQERTKEIGVLRAMGASKKDISRVFNAETMIVGFSAGLLGILVTLVLIVFINIILYALTGIVALKAVLGFGPAVALIIISVLLTLVAGLIPSRVAAKKDPVIALRTE